MGSKRSTRGWERERWWLTRRSAWHLWSLPLLVGNSCEEAKISSDLLWIKEACRRICLTNFKNVIAGTETVFWTLEEKENRARIVRGNPMVREFLPRYMASLRGQPELLEVVLSLGSVELSSRTGLLVRMPLFSSCHWRTYLLFWRVESIRSLALPTPWRGLSRSVKSGNWSIKSNV